MRDGNINYCGWQWSSACSPAVQFGPAAAYSWDEASNMELDQEYRTGLNLLSPKLHYRLHWLRVSQTGLQWALARLQTTELVVVLGPVPPLLPPPAPTWPRPLYEILLCWFSTARRTKGAWNLDCIPEWVMGNNLVGANFAKLIE